MGCPLYERKIGEFVLAVALDETGAAPVASCTTNSDATMENQ
jgi:hypothetical protein